MTNEPKMKDDPDWKGHNSHAYSVTAAELRQFIEQIEAGEAEKKDTADRIKEIYAEAKARGYDSKALRKLVAERKRDKDDLAEEQAIMDLYREALGMRHPLPPRLAMPTPPPRKSSKPTTPPAISMTDMRSLKDSQN